jgi:DNA repair exonuclease SbcCD nuclease subunit
MKIALITDTHFGARNDNIIFQNYFHRFYDNVFFPYLKDNNIKTCIHLGDVVDRRKYINFKTLNYIRNNFIERFWNLGVDTHIIIGNHDVYYKNTNDVNSMMELFTSFDGTKEPWIYEYPREMIFDDTKILMMPWINNTNYTDCMDFIKNTDAQILMGHLEISGFEMHQGQWCDTGMDIKIFDKFDIVLSGHFHHKSNLGNVTYLGNPYEINWGDYNDTRGFHIFDTETRELTFIKNPYRMFYKIYYNDSNKTFEDYKNANYTQYAGTFVKVIVTEKNNPYWFDTMMDSLYKADVVDVSVVENIDIEFEDDDMVNEAEDTLTILSKYVKGLNIKNNKNELDNLLRSLYNESLDYELYG